MKNPFTSCPLEEKNRITQVYATGVLPVKEFNMVLEKLMLSLPAFVRERVFRHKQPLDMQRTLLGEVLIRAIVREFKGLPQDQINIAITGEGKPFLKGVDDFHFNLSHSGDWVVMATSGHEVGIDVELIQTAKYEVAQRFFTSDECRALDLLSGTEKTEYFYSLWTAKESFLKYLGKGLTRALNSFSVRDNNGLMELAQSCDDANTVFFHQYRLPRNHLVSVCSPVNEFADEINILNIHDLFKVLRNEQ
jgi:4'-phosphopantetheinyl transferase